ncbi:ATP-dependent DNA helicase RecG [Enhydrobacter aerosaccus]|uniref:ATP-dependent DNA helicase RecG n=1 Tax=Enhydrobacter aerosaccus TaxID=225324 RepID=A0A1T4L389_9HYPH|nr:ATP-dependent DNA helicase RecG [Enhydrobacter aerosaccus]SJZ49212.1 ATP-dependent DNA helicase RecG [Enhydrobacter aerosaccus]
MRPQSLTPLFAQVTALPGIGPRLGKLVEKLAGPLVVDLLWHLPFALIDRRNAPTVAEAKAGDVATLTVTIGEHLVPRNGRQPYRIWCSDQTGRLCLTYFNGREDYLKKLLPPGDIRVVSGKIEIYQGEVQMTHPDHVVPLDQRDSVLRVEPVYGLTAGLTQRPLQKAIGAALERLPDLPEWQNAAYLARQRWPSWKAALAQAHAPTEEVDLEPRHPARARLAFDELLASQLAVALVRHHNRTLAGRSTKGDGRLQARARASLPFELTSSQKAAVAEIAADMAKPERMVRLLQGDVGSGKTLVALLAMLTAVESGAQAALMAPTELLARQHHATIMPLAEAAGVKLALLTGRDGQRQKKATLDGLADGSIQIVVGTHALVQEDVEFADLALAVVDEQHRFGVHQRMALSSKSHAVDLLVMTATPIPRTLMLAAYGDLDVSKLTEKPAGRQPIDTRTIPLERIGEVVEGISRRVADGARIYWVCPLIEESEEVDLANAEERYRLLQARFPGKVGLVHGRLKGAEREATMAAFADGRLSILVATTVIEVGVDVPAATVMIIEHAERFGLAQLHQLRGRVGRGSAKSTCLLLYAQPLGETAKARLAIMRETEDGFRIAEEDLRLRGAGELLGTRQSGLPDMRLADLAAHAELLEAARDDARLVIERDPDLNTPRGEALRALLYLFRRDDAVRTLRAG